MKWYLKITTKKGTFLFPRNGFKTKHEALKQKELAEKDAVSVELVKG